MLRSKEQREMGGATKLEALREAARYGIAALDRGDFRQFADPGALIAYLRDLAATSPVK